LGFAAAERAASFTLDAERAASFTVAPEAPGAPDRRAS